MVYDAIIPRQTLSGGAGRSIVRYQGSAPKNPAAIRNAGPGLFYASAGAASTSRMVAKVECDQDELSHRVGFIGTNLIRPAV
jgi:hypothetical protein